MNWLELLQQIFEVCIIPLLGVLVGFLVKWIQSKQKAIEAATDNELVIKYSKLLSDTITSCVISTNQTYVEALKAEGKFDANAQKVAFTKTFDAVMSILSNDAKVYLAEIYGDLNDYISNKIEAEVHSNK